MTSRPMSCRERMAPPSLGIYAPAMALLGTVFFMVIYLAASPVGAWYTNRHPAVRNDTWGGALGFFLSWVGFVTAVGFCAWRARKLRTSLGAELGHD